MLTIAMILAITLNLCCAVQVRIGEHWSLSMFESGVVWLVNIAGAGFGQLPTSLATAATDICCA
jgi:hypothetical protein